MHPNPAYRRTGEDRSLAFAGERGFGILTVNGPDAPLAAHIPFDLTADGKMLEAHLVRSNPIWRALETPLPARMIVSGADGYISPDWYAAEDQVPTWNYVAVHLTGTVRRLDADELTAHLARLSARFEDRLLPKKPWTLYKMSDEVMARFLRMIAPVRLEIDNIDSTWKLNQNKPDAMRLNAAKHVAQSIGVELAELSTLMRRPPE
ncbi:FMN-binding negative transcriptional regulator [Algicella marina]|uniref:FMN-binding negative transcriptional regulator n=1 Tax=Algicella marina TaxID=2683284 RepID=A0A6P1T4Q1_9RHOB|nr:FMN-binding negative transcriptional regulator [Algicella marina]QHQ36690.1 FMN-binding negative transcriptional regulator [Algicella marina]